MITHHAEHSLPKIARKIPFFGDMNRGLDDQADELADNLGLPKIAVSGAHRLQDIGTAYINSQRISAKNTEEIMKSLKNILRQKSFGVKTGRVPTRGILDWGLTFYMGIKELKENPSLCE